MALARICWIKDTTGHYLGRFKQSRFVTVARFNEDDTWPQIGWSLVVELNEADCASECMDCHVEYLMDDAPKQFLHVNSRFELLAGQTVVAHGEILQE